MGKNIQKVQDMLDGNYGKIQVGYGDKVEPTRKVGDKWTDSDGYEWIQHKGYKEKVSRIKRGIADKCNDCKSFCFHKRDKQSYNSFGRCYYCQIDFEAKLKSYPLKHWAWVKLQVLQQWTAIDEEVEHWIRENSEVKWKDKALINALANNNVEMTVKKNTQ